MKRPEDERPETGRELILHGADQKAPATLLFLEQAESTPSTGADTNPVLEYWQVIRHRIPSILVLAALGALAGAFVTFRQTPIYLARTTIEVQNPSETPMNIRIGDLGTAGVDGADYLPTQTRILQSWSLRQRVLARMKEEKLPTSSGRDRFSEWRQALGLSAPQPAAAKPGTLPPVDLRARILESTRIVEILCDSPDPAFAAAFANRLVAEYAQANLEAHWNATRVASDFLKRQLDDLRVNLQKSEDQLQTYSRATGLLFTDDRESAEQEKLKQLQLELSRAQAERILRQSAYEIASRSAADSVAEVLDNPRLSDYQSQLATLRRQLAELSTPYTPDHYKVKRVQAQIAELEATLKKERDAVLTRIRNDYQTALRRESLLGAAFRTQAQLVSEQGARSIYYGILKREVDTNRQLYDSLLQKTKEAGIASAMKASNVRVVDPALPPAWPYKPSLMFNLLMGGLSGMLAGVVLAIGRENLDRSVRAPGEAPFHLRLPELGVIPYERTDMVPGHGPSRVVTLAPARGELAPPDGSGVETATWKKRNSILAESFRSVLASILHSGNNGGRPRVILITSATRGTGKSTSVANLGIALAEIDQKVILVDGDLRKPRLHEIFNLANTWGLSDLLRDKTPLADSPLEALAQRTEIPGLYILTSGPGTASISNLFYSHRMSELMLRLRSDFDTVLVDTPPMLHFSDARVLGRLADSAILVLRAGQTKRDDAAAAKKRLVEDGIPLLGTILNGWDLKTRTRYGYSGSGYYYYHVEP